MRLKSTTEVTEATIKVTVESRTYSSKKVQPLVDKILSLRKSNVILEAIHFANAAHQGQARKVSSSTPYIVHPLSVAITLIKYGCSDEVIAASILHDTIEDTKVTYEQIKLHLGKEIADLVQAVTELDKSHSWEERKGAYLAHLRTAPLEAVFISCADKLDNIRSLRKELSMPEIGVKAWDSYNSPPDRQKWFFESLVKTFESRLNEDATGNFKSLLTMFKAEVEKVFGILV